MITGPRAFWSGLFGSSKKIHATYSNNVLLKWCLGFNVQVDYVLKNFLQGGNHSIVCCVISIYGDFSIVILNMYSWILLFLVSLKSENILTWCTNTLFPFLLNEQLKKGIFVG